MEHPPPHNCKCIGVFFQNNVMMPTLTTYTCHKSKWSNFSVLYFNCRSLLPKIDELRSLCGLHHPDCVCAVETWLGPEILDSEYKSRVSTLSD